MRKERTLLIIGIWVMALPFSGFPSTIRTILFVLTGGALVYLAYLFYLQARTRMPKDDDPRMHPFVDNITPNE